MANIKFPTDTEAKNAQKTDKILIADPNDANKLKHTTIESIMSLIAGVRSSIFNRFLLKETSTLNITGQGTPSEYIGELKVLLINGTTTFNVTGFKGAIINNTKYFVSFDVSSSQSYEVDLLLSDNLNNLYFHNSYPINSTKQTIEIEFTSVQDATNIFLNVVVNGSVANQNIIFDNLIFVESEKYLGYVTNIQEVRNSVKPKFEAIEINIQSINTDIDLLEAYNIKRTFIVSGEQDGSNKDFTTDRAFILGSTSVYVDRLRYFKDLDYEEKSNTTFSFISFAPTSEQEIILEGVDK